MIILDTNVISELMAPSPAESVAHWVAARSPTSLYTTCVTQAEILFGVQLLPKGKRRDRIEAAAEALSTRSSTARCYRSAATLGAHARIAAERRRRGKPISVLDAQIAGIARAAGAGLATRNVADFDPTIPRESTQRRISTAGSPNRIFAKASPHATAGCSPKRSTSQSGSCVSSRPARRGLEAAVTTPHGARGLILTYTSRVRLPVDRRRLALHPRAKSPAEGIIETIELSEVVLRLALATGAAQHRPYDLREKARLYVRPLQAVRT